MRFPKPPFKILLEHYRPSPLSVHDCAAISMKHAEADRSEMLSSGVRAAEALVLAGGLARSRSDIAARAARPGDGAPPLLGPYRPKCTLCPHGLTRSARDLAWFLHDQWGKPPKTWQRLEEPPREMLEQTGVVAFLEIAGVERVEGHIDLWNKDHAVGQAHFNADKIWFWRLGD